MSRTFGDLGVFAAFLAAKAREVDAAARRGLEDGAKLIQQDARDRIGHYQGATGPFPAWPSLSPATLRDKTALGYAPPDNPLLREGDLRDSIGVTVSGDTAQIGSASEIAVYQELGTPNAKHPIPPRPFIGPAGFAKGEDAAKSIGNAVTASLAGKR